MKICGNCLHDREAHIESNGHFMYCGACSKLCDTDEYNKEHKHSDTIVQDGVVYKVG